MTKKNKSVESRVEKLVNRWLDEYQLTYKLKNESLNDEIDKALNNYSSKNGGGGEIYQMLNYFY